MGVALGCLPFLLKYIFGSMMPNSNVGVRAWDYCLIIVTLLFAQAVDLMANIETRAIAVPARVAVLMGTVIAAVATILWALYEATTLLGVPKSEARYVSLAANPYVVSVLGLVCAVSYRVSVACQESAIEKSVPEEGVQ